MSVIPELPSRVEESFASCPRFRIAVTGNCGVGKSSLVKSIFNVNRKDIDIADGRPGEADITHEYTSLQNPRFILHDSMGFEHGSTGKCEIVESFLRARAERTELEDRIHAIWHCMETPRTGSRLWQTGDEMVLALAKELGIPVIVVFTKYDRLVMEKLRAPKLRKKTLTDDQKQKEAERDALRAFNNSVQEMHSVLSAQAAGNGARRFLCVKVSTTEEEYIRASLLELTDVTRKNLADVEGILWVPWAAAQQVNARQKVDLSISEGFKKYWLNLGKSTLFRGHTLLGCVRRIHDDIIMVWNFNDPQKILSGSRFFEDLITLVAPWADNKLGTFSDFVSTSGDVVSMVTSFGLPAPIGGVIMTAKYLYSKYQQYPSTAKYLVAYIAHLVVVLHNVFMDTLAHDPPRALNEDLVFDAFRLYKISTAHARVSEKISAANLSTQKSETVTAEAIRYALDMEEGGDMAEGSSS